VDAASLAFAQLAAQQKFWIRVGGVTIGNEKERDWDGKPRIVPPEEMDQWIKDALAAAAAVEKAKPAPGLRVDGDAPGWIPFGRRFGGW
jgi:hypothetical protein